jgi:hypothetical protein
VRSNYHRTLETVFNGCHKTIAVKHFKAMCSEDCVMVIRAVNNPFGPNYREMRGIESMVEYVDTALEAVPDMIFAITDSKFFRKPQNESMVISSYTANGRMIYTIDTLNSEDVEDIGSAISGLQMLYQGGSGADASAEDATVQLVCDRVESAVSKLEASNANNSTNNSGPTTAASNGVGSEALYSFIYSTNNNNIIPGGDDKTSSKSADTPGSSINSDSSIPPISSLADAVASQDNPVPAVRAVTVEPFDYSAKFSQTGASLFDPSSAMGALGVSEGDDDDDDLADIGLNTAAAALGTRPPFCCVTVDFLLSLTPRYAVLAVGETLVTTLGSASTDTVVLKEEGGGLTLRPIPSAASLLSLTPPLSGLNLAGGAPLLAQLSHLHPGGALQSSTVTLPDAQATTAGQDFWLKHRSNVMIVKESAKFCLKEKIPAGRQVYKVKGTMTLTINSDKRIRRIELLHSFDTSMHR